MLSISNSSIKYLTKLYDELKEGETITYYVYAGQVDANGKRGFSYYQVDAKLVGGNEVQYEPEFSVSKGGIFTKQIKGSYSIGSMVAVKTSNDGQTAWMGSGLNIGRWPVQDDISFWEAKAEKLKVQKMMAATMKDESFDARLKDGLKDIKATFKASDNITRQYILAKIINYLNS